MTVFVFEDNRRQNIIRMATVSITVIITLLNCITSLNIFGDLNLGKVTRDINDLGSASSFTTSTDGGDSPLQHYKSDRMLRRGRFGTLNSTASAHRNETWSSFRDLSGISAVGIIRVLTSVLLVSLFAKLLRRVSSRWKNSPTWGTPESPWRWPSVDTTVQIEQIKHAQNQEIHIYEPHSLQDTKDTENQVNPQNDIHPPGKAGIYTSPTTDFSQISSPSSVKDLSLDELPALCDNLRAQLITDIYKTGGHLGSNLGAVELTVALHRVFNSPVDKFLFDVGHQAYVHKMLTGRRDRLDTVRQVGGLSGFTNRFETEHDSFGAGHSSTAISAAVGMSIGRDLISKQVGGDIHGSVGTIIPIVGDGGLTGGMSYEAMNNAGFLKLKNFLCILNDNGQVSLPTQYNGTREPVGALSRILSRVTQIPEELDIIARLTSSTDFHKWRNALKDVVHAVFPPSIHFGARKFDDFIRSILKTGARPAFFEELGFHYIGPVDGHNVLSLVGVLENLKTCMDKGILNKPILLHVKTNKGKGYAPAEQASDKLHGVAPFAVHGLPPIKSAQTQADLATTGKPGFHVTTNETTPLETAQLVSLPTKPKSRVESFTEAFTSELNKLMKVDPMIIAVTAAMPGGTGLEKIEDSNRVFDVGICEQHAVTMAAAAVTTGVRPFVAIYSTFLQRAVDSVVHDAALQKLGVRLVLDRAGFVGPDGATHHGLLDLSILMPVPNVRILAPSSTSELRAMMRLVAGPEYDGVVSVIRFPKGTGSLDLSVCDELNFDVHEIKLGEGKMVKDRGLVDREGLLPTNGLVIPPIKKIAFLSLGTRLGDCIKAAQKLEESGRFEVSVADARWAKPLDEKLVKSLLEENDALITIEEGTSGGFGSRVLEIANCARLRRSGSATTEENIPPMKVNTCIVHPIHVPDRFFEHDTIEAQYKKARMSVDDLIERAKALF